MACAFGKEDVDEIYKNAILPVLKSMEIKPYRVDLIEHNDDIDDKIIELILKCDICIADLTYSRPSAYSGVSGRQFRRHPDTKPVTSGHLIDSIFINIILNQ